MVAADIHTMRILRYDPMRFLCDVSHSSLMLRCGPMRSYPCGFRCHTYSVYAQMWPDEVFDVLPVRVESVWTSIRAGINSIAAAARYTRRMLRCWLMRCYPCGLILLSAWLVRAVL